MFTNASGIKWFMVLCVIAYFSNLYFLVLAALNHNTCLTVEIIQRVISKKNNSREEIPRQLGCTMVDPMMKFASQSITGSLTRQTKFNSGLLLVLVYHVKCPVAGKLSTSHNKTEINEIFRMGKLTTQKCVNNGFFVSKI